MQPTLAWRETMPSRLLEWILIIFLLGLSSSLPVKAEPAPLPALQTVGEFWGQSPDQRAVEQNIHLSFKVLYYDADWHVLWGEDKGGSFFLKTGTATPLPIKPGDIVQLQGSVSTNGGLVCAPSELKIIGQFTPPKPIIADSLLADPSKVNQQLVTLSGLVDEQTNPDPNHLSLILIVGDRLVNVYMLTDKHVQLTGHFIEITGLLVTERTNNQTDRINLWVSDASSLKQKGRLYEDPQFQLPLSTSAQLRTMKEGTPAHVRGVLQLQRQGSELKIADNTGAILIESAQQTRIQNGEMVDVIGTVRPNGNIPHLSSGLYLATSRVPGKLDSGMGTITHINEWFTLPMAVRQQDMTLDATFRINFYDPYWKMLWVQDDRGSYYLHTFNATFNFTCGQLVHIRGLYSEAKGLRAEEHNIEVLENQLRTEAEDVTSSVSEYTRHNSKLVTLTGYVDKQIYTDAQHETLRFICNGLRLDVMILNTSGVPIRQFEGAFVKIRGIYNAVADPASDSTHVGVLVSGPEQINFLHWMRADPSFQLPITPIEKIQVLNKPGRIHVAGVVQESQRRSQVEIRDKTGQLTILCAQDENLHKGEYIEAIGTPISKGLHTLLHGGLLIRSVQSLSSAENSDSGQLLRVVAQIQELNNAQAARQYPVRLTVQCTWSSPAAGYFYAQDSSGGMRFILANANLQRPLAGDLVLVIGETVTSNQEPHVLVHELKFVQTATPPAPIPVNLDQARTGVGSNRSVELQALLRSCQRAGDFLELDYLSSQGSFKGLLPTSEDPAAMVGSIVSIRGINLVNRGKLRTPEVQLLHNNLTELSVAEAKPQSLNDVPRTTLSFLALNPPKPGIERLIRLRGTVTLHEPGSHLYIEEGAEAMRISARQVDSLLPGDNVEVVGLPVWQGDRLVIQEGSYQKTGHQFPAKPVIPKSPYIPDPELEGFLVKVEGRSLDTSNLLLRAGVINLQNDNQLFSCSLGAAYRGSLEIKPGTRVTATGIYHLIPGEGSRQGSFLIELRNASDLEILETPSWWTPVRAMTVVGTFALLLLLAAGWVQLLRRKVAQQTTIIRTQMEKESKLMAELERSARLESLGLLAGGIAHDFNNMLTVVAGNLTLARMEDGVEQAAGAFLAEAEQGALRARALTQQLLTFARGGNPMRKPELLPELVEDEVRKAAAHSKVELQFSFKPDLRRAYIDKAQIAQVIHNLVTNALQAMPQGGRLSVSIANQDLAKADNPKSPASRMLRVSIQDTGEGISSEQLEKIFDPYFSTRKGQRGLGLSLVRSIINKHDGQLSVTSTPGTGSTFTLLLPAANERAEEPHDNKPRTGSKPPLAPNERPRILFMDDEAPIRLIAGTLLRKLGYDAVLVADGDSAVREHRQAMETGRPFNLLVFDLSVPEGLGGREALERIHAVDPQALALVSSGYSNDPVMAEPQRFGFAAVLPKPYQVNDLAHMIDTLLGRKPRLSGNTAHP